METEITNSTIRGSHAIEVFNACVEFENVLALDEVSFKIPHGVLTGVVGPNGGGKSTLFNALVGLQPVAHGKILVNGIPPGKSKGEISYVPQKEKVNWRFPLSVKDVVSLGKLSKLKNKPLFERFIITKDKKIEESLKKVGMWEHRNELISTLSGGQRQRAFIARALTQEANIILLDEAFSGVDITSQKGVLEVLKNLRNEGKTILIATHDLNTLSDRFDEVLCINRHICAHGNPETVFTKDVLIELYGSHEVMFADHQIGQHGHDI
jgi:ABC-type Mn2+/Zn2+ transport system ATPase subunit